MSCRELGEVRIPELRTGCTQTRNCWLGIVACRCQPAISGCSRCWWRPGPGFCSRRLIERVWPRRFVTQNSLDQALSKVPRVLAEATGNALHRDRLRQGHPIFARRHRHRPRKPPPESVLRRGKLATSVRFWICAGRGDCPCHWHCCCGFQAGIRALTAFGANAGPVVLMLPSRGCFKVKRIFPPDSAPCLAGYLTCQGSWNSGNTDASTGNPADDVFLAGQWRVSPEMKVVLHHPFGSHRRTGFETPLGQVA